MKVDSALADRFSLVVGGPFYRLLWRLRLVTHEPPNVLPRVLFLVLVTWVPLLILSALQGLAYGQRVRMPFLNDFAAYARFLIAVPMLVVAEAVIDPYLQRVVRHFSNSGLLCEGEAAAFDRILEDVIRLRDSGLAEALALVLAFLPISSGVGWLALSSETSSWFVLAPPPRFSAAGWWYILVSGVILRFFLFRWLWRFALWVVLLTRVSRLKLHLIATHPDLAGGLGFVAMGQMRFGFLFFVGGVVIAATMGNAVAYRGVSIRNLEWQMIAYVVLAPVVVLGPLLLLIPKLRKVRRSGVLEYSALANRYVQSFDSKWVQGRPAEERLLGTSDIQSLADLGSSFDVVQRMRVAPISKQAVIQCALLAGSPFLFLLVIATPLDKILGALLKVFF